MENREQQILSEIKQLMNSVRLQLEQLDTKMAELQQIYDPQEFESEPIDLGVFPLDLDGDVALSVETEEVTEEATENVAEEVAAFESEPETVEEPEVEDEDLPVEAEEEEPVGDSLFMSVEETPTTIHQQVQSAAVQTAVIDVMAKKHAWRSNRPGTPVKDIRAAIALVDRALFINRLFGEDAMKFMDTLNHINQMSNLDEAVEYLASAYPEWDFDSDVVYRFMMAVRRKIN
jgi:hypothetical protein